VRPPSHGASAAAAAPGEMSSPPKAWVGFLSVIRMPLAARPD
jgi:hypothetical protein